MQINLLYMAKKRKRKHGKRDIPHCSDQENHVLVKTRESVFWRKRGKLNKAFATNVDLSRITGPAGGQVVNAEARYERNRCRPITLRISNALRKFLKEKKQLGLSELEGIEMQRDYALHQLLLAPYEIIEGLSCQIRITLDKACVKSRIPLQQNFYFEGIILYGDVAKEGGLKLDTVESKL